MASRQMAFQMTEFEYREALKMFIELREKGVDVKDYLARVTDEKRRYRLSAALQMAVKCHAEGKDPLLVRKIVCWRDAQGKPGLVEAHLSKVS
jgi:hypothetical protein